MKENIFSTILNRPGPKVMITWCGTVYIINATCHSTFQWTLCQ